MTTLQFDTGLFEQYRGDVVRARAFDVGAVISSVVVTASETLFAGQRSPHLPSASYAEERDGALDLLIFTHPV